LKIIGKNLLITVYIANIAREKYIKCTEYAIALNTVM
jgi:hypothetical protein